MNYVGIVLVSHSKELVSGLLALLHQVQPHVPIAIAGGTDDDEIGTSAQKIRQAIESVYSDAGVVIFFDLGSALMNAELAIEWLEGMDKIRIVDSPLVEGSFAATVESGCGGTLDEVVKIAEDAKKIEKR